MEKQVPVVVLIYDLLCGWRRCDPALPWEAEVEASERPPLGSVVGGTDYRAPMETVEEYVEEYSWREVVLPRLIPVVPHAAPELERETGERRRGRDLLVAVDFGPNSRNAFRWALAHLARIADTLHLVYAVSSVHNDLVYNKSQELMDELASH